MSPLSADPERRRRQLANLQPGRGAAGPGNKRRLAHGGYSTIAAARLDDKRRELYDALAADAPLRAEDGELPRHDALAVRLLAETLCRLDSVTAYLDLHGQLTEKGEERSAVAVADRLTGRAIELARELGMTPASRAKLGLDLVRSRDLAQEMSALDADSEGGEHV